MTYALRKLIAFVFLGGMFWFIYQDLDNLDKPWFMHALGMLAVVFAFFWLLIPMVVVRLRIRRRVRQNRERYERWLEEGGTKKARLDGSAVLHEKGTLYVDARTPVPGVPDGGHVGRPSEVAFPGWRRTCRVAQRTHCYITNSRLSFAGKGLDFGIPFTELKSFSATPGGIVFESDGESAARFAFTFQNPLVAADLLRFAMGGQ